MKKLFIIAVAAMAVSCGSKQHAQQPESDTTAVATDTIAQQAEQQAATDAKAIERIQEFYKKYIFDETARLDDIDGIINEYCTKKLAQKLKADYDYDGDGYAIWKFRSDAQDGNSDVSGVTKIEPLGEGRYKVHYNDMGTIGSCIITVVVDGDKVLFDEISNREFR